MRVEFVFKSQNKTKDTGGARLWLLHGYFYLIVLATLYNICSKDNDFHIFSWFELKADLNEACFNIEHVKGSRIGHDGQLI